MSQLPGYGPMGFPLPPTWTGMPPAGGASSGGWMDRTLDTLLPPGGYESLLPPAEQQALRRRALMTMGASLLSNAGPSPERRSTGQLIGNAVLAGQQVRDQSQQNAMQMLLMRKQLEKASRPVEEDLVPTIAPDGSIIYTPKSKAAGMKVPERTGNHAEPTAPIQLYSLYAQQEREAGRQPKPFMDWSKDYASATAQPSFSFPTFGNIPHVANNRSGGTSPLMTLPEVTGNTSAIAEAETTAKTNAAEQAKRDSTFQEDMNVIDDEILRTQRLLSEFKAGKYQTGPLAGRLPNFRTAAQDLQREQGKDVIKAISSATFGALSEGEREFLRSTGVSETANEESNVNLLEQRLESLQRAKDRLQTRSRLGIGPNAAPAAPIGVGQSTTVNGVTIKRTK